MYWTNFNEDGDLPRFLLTSIRGGITSTKPRKSGNEVSSLGERVRDSDSPHPDPKQPEKSKVRPISAKISKLELSKLVSQKIKELYKIKDSSKS